MEFDFSAEQKQLKNEARRFLADRCGRDAVRAVLDGPASTDRALWRRLGELGFLGAAIPEEYGGIGAGYLEACVLAEELGRAVAPVPYASSIALAAECLMLAGSEQQKRRWLPLLASGAAIGKLAGIDGPGPHAFTLPATSVRAGGRGLVVDGRKLPVADGDIADFALVPVRDDAGALSLTLIELGDPGVTRRTLESIDPTRSQAELVFADVAAEPLGAAGEGGRILERVFDRAAVLIAFEQLGGAERALEMARDYAQERFAFGRPIGSLQAVKHMLADMYVSATLARSNCYYGAWALSTNATELAQAAATARVSATQAYQHCARNNIQVHGGMGFTWEFDCHLYYRRSNLLAAVLGPLSHWEDRLVQCLVDARTPTTALAGAAQ
ncbi:MAG: acyl-CoA dehydrogenase family protein [Burkholderiaceae bacterium]